MCYAEFMVKYVLFIVNLAFSLLGLAIIGLGIAALVYLADLSDILPVGILPISIIVLGTLVFFLGFLACCGAVRESRCMLWTYSIIVTILASIKVYLTVVIFNHLSELQSTVNGWIEAAFNNGGLRPAFHVLEASFRCCGLTGPNSYTMNQDVIPVTCCANPSAAAQCTSDAAFSGCADSVGRWFESFGSAIGSVLIVIISVEVVAVIFALFLSNSIRIKRRKDVY